MRRLIFFAWLAVAMCVDHSIFKTCEQSSFCRRCRNMEPNKSPYQLNLDTLQVQDDLIETELLNTQENKSFKLILTGLVDSTFRLQISEIDPLRERFRSNVVFKEDPQPDRIKLDSRDKEHVVISSGKNSAQLFANPFRIDFYSDGVLVATVNARGLFKFEHFRTKPKPKENDGVENEEANNNDPITDPGAWEENFKSHRDSKPFGPSAVAMDVTFHGAAHAYGLPEHADRLTLRDTKGKTDPYRLYNLDVFEYELNSPMAIYGSVPILYAHGSQRTVGFFWNNPTETWIDVTSSAQSDMNVVNSIVNFVSRSGSKADEDNKVETHFMSESGVIDAFFMLGPKPKDVIKQYVRLTGSAPLPQYFSIAYHQSRWNYNDENDLASVVEQFDEHDLPMDVIWLDIEYTDGKKYFTWDPIRFPHPLQMQQNLTSLGRKLVVIIDPHIKREGGYFVHEAALRNNYYVNNAEGNVYEGWCWPGSSSYLDFLNPTVFEYYKSLYALNTFPSSTNDMYLWNDMNEPSVFNGPEVTMPKDCLHFDGWEHRDIHNLYGLLQTKGTYEALLKRSEGTLRPFILTRSHFAGSQRYAAVWTGDNAARWDHLAISIPMCLSLSLGGISFCGADVGGFFGFPEAELMGRWFQTGAFLPFFRSHSHIDTKRHEPYMYPEETRNIIRASLRKRYSYLPFWYTLFREHEVTGLPIMRPLFMEFPDDPNVWDIESTFMLGDTLLVHPVTETGVTEVKPYFPGGKTQLWYDIDTYDVFEGIGFTRIPVDLQKIPVYQRGGTIVPKKERVRRASTLTHDDPYTLIVAVDSKGYAYGTLYIDDGESFDYQRGKYVHMEFKLENGELTARKLDKNGSFETKAWLERIVIVGDSDLFTKATLKVEKIRQPLDILPGGKNAIIIRKPQVNMALEWSITLEK